VGNKDGKKGLVRVAGGARTRTGGEGPDGTKCDSAEKGLKAKTDEDDCKTVDPVTELAAGDFLCKEIDGKKAKVTLKAGNKAYVLGDVKGEYSQEDVDMGKVELTARNNAKKTGDGLEIRDIEVMDGNVAQFKLDDDEFSECKGSSAQAPNKDKEPSQTAPKPKDNFWVSPTMISVYVVVGVVAVAIAVCAVCMQAEEDDDDDDDDDDTSSSSDEESRVPRRKRQGQ
jgi:hypothetical protein